MLLEILEAIFPDKNLVDKTNSFVAPHQSVSIIAETLPVSETIYRPSLRDKALHKYSLLPARQKNIVLQIIDDRKRLDMRSLEPTTIDSLLDILDYKRNEADVEDQPRFTSLQDRLFTQIASQQIEVASQSVPKKENDPTLAHRTRKMHLGLIYKDNQLYPRIRLKLGYHDLLDRSQGFELDDRINYMDLQVSKDPEVKYDLKIAEILSLGDLSSLDPRPSWHLYGGSRSSSHSSNHVIYAAGGVGGSIWLGSNALTTMVHGDLTNSRLQSRLTLSLLETWSHQLRSFLELASDSILLKRGQLETIGDRHSRFETRWTFESAHQLGYEIKVKKSVGHSFFWGTFF